MVIIDNHNKVNMVECQECGKMRSGKEDICPSCGYGSGKKLHHVNIDIKIGTK